MKINPEMLDEVPAPETKDDFLGRFQKTKDPVEKLVQVLITAKSCENSIFIEALARLRVHAQNHNDHIVKMHNTLVESGRTIWEKISPEKQQKIRNAIYLKA